MKSLYEFSQHLSEELKQLKEEAFDKIQSLEIDCTVLPRQGQEGDCRYHSSMSSFFEPLMKISSPALYWFEVTSSHTARELHFKIQTLNAQIERSVPAFKKGFSNWDSRVLYVGKVKTKITDRMVVHLGYGRDKRTQGLQLCHWASDLELKLRLNYLILPDGLREVTSVFERRLAVELQPIIGKHK
jgi:hypothetical protein